jgi:hypothetical protein
MDSETDHSTPDGWLRRTLKKTWNLLLQAGIWISTFVASMLLPPVTGLAETEADPSARLLKYTRFIVAVVVGLSFVLAGILNKRRHLWVWIILTIVFLGTSVICINWNYQLNNTLTCTCNNKAVVRGTIYKQSEVVARFFPTGVDCSNLCDHFVDQYGKVIPEKVWTESSINDSRRLLFLSYLVCFPAVALTIVSIIQAIYCLNRTA